MKIISIGYSDFAHWGVVFPDAKLHVLRRPADIPAITEGDIVIFHGGTDINPYLYGEHQQRHTQSPDNYRDEFEVEAMVYAQTVGAFVYGICRGAQLACVVNGGRLIQHIEGHHGDHPLDDRPFRSNSCHHQQMVPTKEAEIIARCDDTPEVVYWPQTKAFGVQGHPEWLAHDDPFVEWVMQTAMERWEIC